MAGLVPFNRRNTSLMNNSFEDFYNVIDDFFNDNWPSKRSLINDTFKVDVQENDNEYFIEAELPGVKKEEINLELNEGRLNISVVREENVNEEKKNFVHKERRYSSMNRSIYLADSMSEGIKAKLDNGVLSVTVPKQEKQDNSYKIDIE